jgi:DNA-binding CsgD family transcriptional regulator
MELSVADLAFHQRLARLMDCLDNDLFWPAVARFLRERVAFNCWTSMIFQAGRSPVVLGEGGDDGDTSNDDLFSEYVNGLYVLDPFYQFSLKPFQPGLYRLEDVYPEHFRETEYFKRYFIHNVVADEVQFLMPLEGRGVLSMSLGSRSAFSDPEIGALCLFCPWLMSLMRHRAMGVDVERAAAAAAAIHAPNAATNPTPLDEWLRNRSDPPLTDREVETTLLILAGHAAKVIARRMGITLETVKTHKRHLYRKLGVSSQSALFALYLGAGGPANEFSKAG